MQEHPIYLTRSGERARAAQAIDTAVGADMEAALVAADTLDLVSQAVLAARGVADPAVQRTVLSLLWNEL